MFAEVARAEASTIEVRREPTVDYNARHLVDYWSMTHDVDLDHYVIR